MRDLRFAGRILAVTAFVILPLVARAGDGKIHRMNEKTPNRYIVMLYEGQAAEAIGPEMETRHAGKVSAIMKHLGMFSIDLPNEAAAEAIASDPRVALVQEDGLMHVASCNRALDPSGSQWALAHLTDLTQSTMASDGVGSGFQQVRVYLFDSPIHTNWCIPSTDLAGKVQEIQDFVVTKDPQPGGNQQHDANGITSHGTAMASVLAGNTYGVVQELPSLVSLVVVNEGSGLAADNWILQAGEYAISTHRPGQPAVASISLASTIEDKTVEGMYEQMVDNGIFVVVSAGNGNGTTGTYSCLSTPGAAGGSARYPGLMVVGATDFYGNPAAYSDYGDCVDVWAPGGTSAVKVATSVGTGWGTSFSAPEVAGAAVLLLSTYPTSTPASVWYQLKGLETYMYGGVRTLKIPACPNFCICDPPPPTVKE